MSKAVGALLAICVTFAGCEATGIAHGVTAERIRSIRPGMTETELVKCLGPPLDNRPWGRGALVFYARETPLINHSPTLWVYVENAVVRQIEAKRSVWFLENEGLYVRRDGMAWESPAFAKTFK
jgi:hypothetical protein